MNKYNAQAVYADKSGKLVSPPTVKTPDSVLRFASLFEWQVWRVLCSTFSQKNIARELPYVIKPKTKEFNEIVWKPDFTLHKHFLEPFAIVEAKGFATTEFVLKLKLFQYAHPRLYSKLIVVTPSGKLRGVKTKNLVVLTLDELEQTINLLQD